MFRRKKESQPTDDAATGDDGTPQAQEKRVLGLDDPMIAALRDTGNPQPTPGELPDELPGEAPAEEAQEAEAAEEAAPVPPPAEGPEANPESSEAAADDGSADDDNFDRRSAWYVVRKSIREFGDDSGTDIAAGLTYYSVLAIFPALLALLSLLGIFGQGEKSVNAVLDVLRPLVSAKTLNDIHDPLTRLAHSEAATATLAVGIVGALWSASAWVRAFSRAMNRIYEVEEGRPAWRLYPMTYLVTIVTVALSAVVLVILGASGPVARSLGDKLDLGDQAVDVWNWAKWPVLVLIVVAIIAILYHFTPNVKLPKFRILSVGAFVALLVWVLASVGFAFYVANFGSYDRTYGSVAGVVVALLWLWITNVALVYGAELDSEVERARELHRGIESEGQLRLPERSRRGIEKAEARRAKDRERGRRIREQRVGAGDPSDRPF